jgi:hypothetical protein
MLSWFVLVLPSIAAEQAAAPQATTPQAGPNVSVTPVVTYVKVNGDSEKFREDVWMKDGWTGGIEEFTLQEKFGKNTLLELEGRGIFDQHDYKLRLEIVKPDVGFIRAGFTQYRKYFDGTGGFYPLFRIKGPPTVDNRSFELDRDLGLDIGDIYVDVGLTLPNLPKLTLGYERQYKTGAKSMVEWGSVTETLTAPPRPVGSLPLGSVTKKIYPAFKDIDETVDILKFEVAHDIKNLHLGDEFRFEHYQNSTMRLDDAQRTFDSSGSLTASKNVTVKENFSHDNFSNVFHLETWLNEKVYGSAGYLFSTLNGDAGLRITTDPYSAANDKDWFTRSVDLEQDSHVLNLNILAGPFGGFTAYAGVQAEKTDTEGSANAVLTEFPDPIGTGPVATIRSENDKASLEENLGVRFTLIPFTILYAEGQWIEQDIDLFERELEDGSLLTGSAFKRNTDTDVFRQQYTAGFNTSPLRNVTLSGRYRHSIRDNDYDTHGDTTDGYSAFITGQKFTSDEVTAKLTVRPISRVSLSLKYQLVSTDIETSHDPVATLGIPSGTLISGNFDANIYSVSITVTPISRMYLTGLFSLQDTRTIAFDHGAHSVITYQGNVYTVIATAGYAIDNKTDLTIEYSFSRADDFKNNGFDNTPKAGFTSSDYGLPLGLDNERHAAVVTLARKFTENIIGRLRYGFYQFHESSTGGIDNYSAHLASASCSLRF